MLAGRRSIVLDESKSFINEFSKIVEVIGDLIDRYDLSGSPIEKNFKLNSDEIVNNYHQDLPVRDLVRNFLKEIGDDISVAARNKVIQSRRYQNVTKVYRRFIDRDFSFYGRFLEDLDFLLHKFDPEELRKISNQGLFRFIDRMRKSIKKSMRTTSVEVLKFELRDLFYKVIEFPYNLERSIGEAFEEISDRLDKKLT